MTPYSLARPALSPARKAALVTLVYAVVLVATLFAARYRSQLLPPAETHINQAYAFPRVAGPACTVIGDASRLALFVDDMDSGLRAVGCTDDRPAAIFLLRHGGGVKTSAETDRAVWDRILGDPLATANQPRRLGYDIRWLRDGQPTQQLAAPNSRFSFYIFEWWSPAAVSVVLLVWGLIVYLAKSSALLRDAGAPGLPLALRTFSLARTQMAWWFAIIFAAFVFLWLVTGEMPTLSGQALALLGISSATTMASVGIASDRPTATGELGVFFRDLLSDANGIAIQRFQMLVMTIALGLIFLIQVATRLTMPEFDPSLLTLLGISAGTYVGLKIPEGAGVAKAPTPVAGGSTVEGRPDATRPS